MPTQFDINCSLYRAMRTEVDPTYVVPAPSNIEETADAMRIRWVREADKRSRDAIAIGARKPSSAIGHDGWENIGAKVRPTYVYEDADRQEMAFQGMGIRTEWFDGNDRWIGLTEVLPSDGGTSGNALAEFERSVDTCSCVLPTPPRPSGPVRSGTKVRPTAYVAPDHAPCQCVQRPIENVGRTVRTTWFACNERGCKAVGIKRSDVKCGHGKVTTVAHEVPSEFLGSDAVDTLTRTGTKNRPGGRSSSVRHSMPDSVQASGNPNQPTTAMKRSPRGMGASAKQAKRGPLDTVRPMTTTAATTAVRTVSATDGRKAVKESGTAVRNHKGRKLIKVNGPARTVRTNEPIPEGFTAKADGTHTVRTKLADGRTAYRKAMGVTLAELSPDRLALLADARVMLDSGTIG
jgi:hypothetical protein